MLDFEAKGGLRPMTRQNPGLRREAQEPAEGGLEPSNVATPDIGPPDTQVEKEIPGKHNSWTHQANGAGRVAGRMPDPPRGRAQGESLTVFEPPIRRGDGGDPDAPILEDPFRSLIGQDLGFVSMRPEGDVIVAL